MYTLLLLLYFCLKYKDNKQYYMHGGFDGNMEYLLLKYLFFMSRIYLAYQCVQKGRNVQFVYLMFYTICTTKHANYIRMEDKIYYFTCNYCSSLLIYQLMTWNL